MQTRLDPGALARELLDAEDPRLRALLRRSALRATLALARCWGLIGFALVIAALRPGPITWTVAFLLIGTQQYALSILSHEGKHRNLFDSPRVNDAVTLWLTSAPLGTDFLAERLAHLSHHSNLGNQDDPDRDLYRAEDKADLRSFLLYLSGLTTMPGVRRRSRGPQGRSFGRSLVALVRQRSHAIPAQIVIFGVFAFELEWWLYVPLWIAPLFVLMLIPQRIRQFCEHAQPILPDAAGDPHRLVTYRPGRLERFVIAPFNMSYHAEHHLWSSLPWFNLPRLASFLPEEAPIEVRGGYFAFLSHYFHRLPLEGRPVPA